MAQLALQPVPATGLNPTVFSSCAGGGDTVKPRGVTELIVRNLDASAKTVTLVRPGTEYGVAVPDMPVIVAAGTIAVIPVPHEFRDPTDGLVDITYSAVTSLTIAATVR